MAARLQCLLERRSELSVEVGIDNGVEGRVEVAHPEDSGYHHVWARTHVVPAQGCDHVPGNFIITLEI